MSEVIGNFDEAMPWAGMKRCIVNPDHSVEGYLDASNSNNWADGTAVNWSEIEGAGQNVMVEIPKFYYAKVIDGDKRHFAVADEPVDTPTIGIYDWELHPAFMRDRINNCDVMSGTAEEVDFRYAPAFKGWVDGSNRLRSLPNKQPTVDKNITAFRDHAKNNGVGWSQMDFNLHFAIQMLYITEYGHPDSQTTIGRGFVDKNTAAATTGATLEYGNSTFGETTGKKQMSYRGIEDWWGNVRTWLDGCYYNNNNNVLIGNKGYNNTGSGYENLGGTYSGSGNIRRIHADAKAGFTIGGDGGGYEADGLHDYGNLNSGRLPFAGGLWSNGAGAGAFYSYSLSASHSNSNLGAALCL